LPLFTLNYFFSQTKLLLVDRGPRGKAKNVSQQQ
jgi:hypothetical protein